MWGLRGEGSLPEKGRGFRTGREASRSGDECGGRERTHEQEGCEVGKECLWSPSSPGPAGS